MSKKILVTGGAGFIGSFLVDKLIEQGNDVRIFDNIEAQVHGKTLPSYLNKGAEFIRGDITDEAQLKAALQGCEIVFHQAAVVGVGQSMYQIAKYSEVNMQGTANLLDLIVNKGISVRKFLVAASMSEYGEGLYFCERCKQKVKPGLRAEDQLKRKRWNHICPDCKSVLHPIPTPETASLDSTSVYAITKRVQEELVLNVCRAYGIPAVALRYFNVYGPRQSLSNPYTGVAAIFMSRIKNKNPPVIFEDGLQTRDFISVHDIVDANIAAMQSAKANFEIFNVGTGAGTSILDVAKTLAKIYNSKVKPAITNEYRKGDIRHCFADITKIKQKLGWQPKVKLEAGFRELVKWSEGAKAEDKFDLAQKELKQRGLV